MSIPVYLYVSVTKIFTLHRDEYVPGLLVHKLYHYMVTAI